MREGCRSDEYREALGCPVTDPEELWSLPAIHTEDQQSEETRSLSPLEEGEEGQHVRWDGPQLKIFSLVNPNFDR